MNTLKCMIVDDEPLAVRMLENYIARTEGLKLTASFNDPVRALQAFDELEVDLLFLDIQMPDLDGLNLSRQVPSATRIIFTTAFRQYAYESYEVNALDFLLKPIRYQKFLTAIEKARQWFIRDTIPTDETNRQNSMFIRADSMLHRIDFDKILYVSGLKDYVNIFLEGEKRPIVTHLTMKSVEEILPVDRFMRVHRSYIIALDKIRAIDRNNCIYIGNEVIRVTDAYREEFTAFLEREIPR